MSYHLEVLENLRKAELKFSEVAISEKNKTWIWMNISYV